ncbi:MAG: hypothetical protein ACRD5R_12255 [Candidatus Acidiferrales bacterium]
MAVKSGGGALEVVNKEAAAHEGIVTREEAILNLADWDKISEHHFRD